MIPQQYTGTLFNSIAFHDPYFDRVPSEDYFVHSKDMYAPPSVVASEPYQDTFPPTYSAFRRMSADTQASSADSAVFPSPNSKPINDKSNSVVLPPIHDLNRPLSPETSDASSTRSPQWTQPSHPQQQQHHGSAYSTSPQMQHQQHQHQHQQHQQQAPLAQFTFPPLDNSARRPQLHINPDQRAVASYPTPTTASSTLNGYTSSSNGSAASSYSASTYAAAPSPYALGRRPEVDQHAHHQYPVNARSAPPPPPPPVVTPASLAAAVGTQQRRRGKLPKPVTEFLKKWLLAHTDHPYPTEDEKKWLCSETGLSMSQVSNWMINARRRILAPAAKANAAAAAAAAAVGATSSASAATATPYYTGRSPPLRTVSGSSTDAYTNGSAYSAHSRRESYAPYPSPASRATNSHPSPYSSTAGYTSSAPAYTAYHYQAPAPTSSASSAGIPSASYASATLAPFGDSHESSRTKSPSTDFAYAPQ